MHAHSLFALAAALTTSLLVGTTALAAPSAERTISVSYADLDVTTPAGRAALERRVAAAAKQVCANDGLIDPRARLLASQCRATASTRALTKVDAMIAAAETSRRLAAAPMGAGGR